MICAGKRLCRIRRWPGSPRRRLCRRGRPGWILCTPRRCSRRTGCSCRFRLCLCRSSRRFAQAAVRGWMERNGSHIARFAEHGWTKRFCRRLCRNGSPSRSRFRNPNSRFLRLRSRRMRSFWKNLLFWLTSRSPRPLHRRSLCLSRCQNRRFFRPLRRTMDARTSCIPER